MNWPADFGLNDGHCDDVLRGAYSVPIEPATILDIGANVGAFARWASVTWPNAKINCYEPHPGNFEILKKTKAHYGLTAELFAVAVADKIGIHTLYSNGFNCGEWSLLNFDPKGGEVQVPVVDAIDLPEADLIKIDTEGMEPHILKRWGTERLSKTKAVVLEYHASPHVVPIIWMMQQAGLKLYELTPHLEHRGILKFVRP